MGKEIDLLKNYPKTKRDINSRNSKKNENIRKVARLFGEEFFDGDRDFGYGGYYYNPKFWQPVIPTFKEHFGITENKRLLDVGCGKGFMLYDMQLIIPGLEVRGIDISEYAIEKAVESVKPYIQVGDAKVLPYEDNYFDVVISINTIHNLDRDECAQALCEIERVGKGKSFITVDAYRNDEEKKLMEAWNLTAKTMMHVDEWKDFFDKVGYTGDYYWFIP